LGRADQPANGVGATDLGPTDSHFRQRLSGQTYTLERSINLSDWTVRRTTTPASDGRYELLENTAGSGGFFYRLRW